MPSAAAYLRQDFCFTRASLGPTTRASEEGEWRGLGLCCVTPAQPFALHYTPFPTVTHYAYIYTSSKGGQNSPWIRESRQFLCYIDACVILERKKGVLRKKNWPGSRTVSSVSCAVILISNSSNNARKK